MNKLQKNIRSILSGAIAGAVVLGLIGRVAAEIISSLMGKSSNLSSPGIIEALFVGTALGIAGGLLHIQTRKIKLFNRLIQSIILGIILFSLSILVSVLFMNLKINFSPPQILTLVTVFCVFIIYGIGLDLLFNQLKQIYRK